MDHESARSIVLGMYIIIVESMNRASNPVLLVWYLWYLSPMFVCPYAPTRLSKFLSNKYSLYAQNKVETNLVYKLLH